MPDNVDSRIGFREVYDLIEGSRREQQEGRREVLDMAEALRVSTEATNNAIRLEYRMEFRAIHSEINGEGDAKGIKGRLRDLEGDMSRTSKLQAAFTIIASSLSGVVAHYFK